MFLFLFSCILISCASGEMRLCSTQVSTFCREPNSGFTTIPRNVEELEQICPTLMDLLECRHSYDLACKGRSEYIGLPPPMYYHRLKSLLDEVCDGTSTAHQVLGRSLPCITSRVSRNDYICRSAREQVNGAYENFLAMKAKRKISKTLTEKKQCLNLMASVSCAMEDIQTECGFLAYETANDILMRSQIFPSECGLDIFLELKDVVEDLNLSSSVKARLRKYFVVETE